MNQQLEGKSRRGMAIYKSNPFLAVVLAKKRVESTKFVKLYPKGAAALCALSSAGAKVFELLYTEVQKNIGKEQVFLSFGLVDQTATPMASATYQRGMAELISKGFLAATRAQGLYWLNPEYMWNGDRSAFVKEYYRSPGTPTLRTKARKPPLSPAWFPTPASNSLSRRRLQLPPALLPTYDGAQGTSTRRTTT